MANAASFKIEGMDKLMSDIEKLGKLPQKHVTASAKKGMGIVLRDARANAPFDTGNLKKGIILNGEKTRIKGKKVYEAIFDPAMNDKFQKKNKEGKVTGYYPVSQEYGYFTKNGKYIPGYRFLHDSFNSNAEIAAKTMSDEIQKKIDAELKKARLK